MIPHFDRFELASFQSELIDCIKVYFPALRWQALLANDLLNLMSHLTRENRYHEKITYKGVVFLVPMLYKTKSVM